MKRRKVSTTKLILDVATVAVLVYYCAEIAGYGDELRYSMQRGISWCRYFVAYAAWAARRSTYQWK